MRTTVSLLVLAGLALVLSGAAEPAGRSEAARAPAAIGPPAWLKDVPYRIVYESFRDGN